MLAAEACHSAVDASGRARRLVCVIDSGLPFCIMLTVVDLITPE